MEIIFLNVAFVEIHNNIFISDKYIFIIVICKWLSDQQHPALHHTIVSSI